MGGRGESGFIVGLLPGVSNPGISNRILSMPGLRLERRMASLSEPGPLSFVLVTVIITPGSCADTRGTNCLQTSAGSVNHPIKLSISIMQNVRFERRCKFLMRRPLFLQTGVGTKAL